MARPSGPSSKPAGEPAALPHQPAFQKLILDQPTGLAAVVAFGLYMEGECRWAGGAAAPRTDQQVRDFHEAGCMPHSMERVTREAEQMLEQFSSDVVRAHEKLAAKSAVEGAIEAVHGTRKSFFRGATEAVVGAFAWTVILIVASVIAQRLGIDLLEAYKKAAGQ